MITEQQVANRILALEEALDDIGVGSPTLYALGLGAKCELERLLKGKPSVAQTIGIHAERHQELGWWNGQGDDALNAQTASDLVSDAPGDDSVGGTDDA